MKNINVLSFKISEISNITPDVRVMNKKDFLENSFYSVSDHLDFSVQTGAENLYFDLIIYCFDSYRPQKLRIVTKNDHKKLRALICYFLNAKPLP